MGSRRKGDRFHLVDFKNPQIRFPAMKLEQRVMVGAEVRRDALSGNGVIKHSAQRYPLEVCAPRVPSALSCRTKSSG